MELPRKNIRESARWLVSLRWAACACVFAVVWLAAEVFRVLDDPLPLYLVGFGMIAYNFLLYLRTRGDEPADAGAAARGIILQIALDLAAMTLLLYFSDITRNPFIFFFVFHMIIGSILLPGRIPYLIAMLASVMVGAVFLLEYFGLAPVHPLHFAGTAAQRPDGTYLLGLFIAFSSTLAITVYFTTSIQCYVQRARDEIRQKEKIIGIGQLVAGFAHQISNPLDGLQNCLDSISASPHVGEDPKLAEYVEMMRGALARIERIARRLQEFARPHGIRFSTFDLDSAVEEVLMLLQRADDRGGITVVFERGGVGLVRGDLYAVQEVVFHLCTNAFAAMPEGGKLTIRTRLVCPGGPSGFACVEVTDTGSGIPPDQLENVFEPFFTTRSKQGGTGLGLWICDMLISEMGGRIEAESEPGRGSTFRVVLPRADSTGSGR